MERSASGVLTLMEKDANRLSAEGIREIQLGADCWTVVCTPADGGPSWSLPFANLNILERKEVVRRAKDPFGVGPFWWLCNLDW